MIQPYHQLGNWYNPSQKFRNHPYLSVRKATENYWMDTFLNILSKRSRKLPISKIIHQFLFSSCYNQGTLLFSCPFSYTVSISPFASLSHQNLNLYKFKPSKTNPTHIPFLGQIPSTWLILLTSRHLHQTPHQLFQVTIPKLNLIQFLLYHFCSLQSHQMDSTSIIQWSICPPQHLTVLTIPEFLKYSLFLGFMTPLF